MCVCCLSGVCAYVRVCVCGVCIYVSLLSVSCVCLALGVCVCLGGGGVNGHTYAQDKVHFMVLQIGVSVRASMCVSAVA